MKIAFLKFSKEQAPKVAALLSQYDSYRLLISFATDEMFSTTITLCFEALETDLQLMGESDLKNYFKK